MSKKLVLIGAGEFALIAYQYFTFDSDYEVVGFAVEKDYLKDQTLEGLPVVPYEELEIHFPAINHHFFVAIPASKMNSVRKRFYTELKERGCTLASYVSSNAFVWRNAKVGENTFIFENNVIQPYVSIGNNCILWSGNHIGHRTVIQDHAFLASHVVVSGYCTIGESAFLGVNATLNDHITIGALALVGSGALVAKSVEPERIVVGSPARPVPGKSSLDTDI
ncbi:acetyltransferase [Limnobacter sp.]|uniref:acetyltransferase n=1 Tax=Limnobacter sp. TaxID=2003368 RepID=UPI00351192AE